MGCTALNVRVAIVVGLIGLGSMQTRAQDAVPNDVRDDFSRFFRLGQPPQPVVGPTRAAAAAAIRQAPTRAAELDRLLQIQESRRPQPNVRAFIANNAVLEEVAAGADRDFAQVIFWNEVAMRISANDHTPVPPGVMANTHPFEQLGPARTARAMAMVHLAMFEAVNAVQRRYTSYRGIQGRIFQQTSFPANIPEADVSVRHAIAISAHATLLHLYPAKAADLGFTLTSNLTAIQAGANQANAGIAIGQAAADAVIAERMLDGSELEEDVEASHFDTPDPFKWKRDPLSPEIGIALGALWGHVKPFVIERADVTKPRAQGGFRVNPPPAPDSTEFRTAFGEVLQKGSDPNAGAANPPGNLNRRPPPAQIPTNRTADEEFIGKFWAYDGTALLCAPPRLYNMIATSLALKERRATFTDALELARYLALVNIAMADAGLCAWDSKFYYIYPRPVTLFRAAQPGSSPIPVAAPFWTPLGAPVTNGMEGRLNFTPPFPAYPSGHATFGGALFQTFRRFWPNEADQGFTFVSDEYNGLNSDPGAAQPRPRLPKTFNNFRDPEAENGKSRIYLGIHWQFDADAGIAQGNAVADYVFDHAFRPVQ